MGRYNFRQSPFFISSISQISYSGVGKTQLNFLRLLSEKAAQTFNVTCLGSQGCFDSTSNMVEKAIRLQGANDGLLSLMKDDPSIKITQVTIVVIVIIITILLIIIVIVTVAVIRLCFYETNGKKRKTKVIVLFMCAFKCVEVSRLQMIIL